VNAIINALRSSEFSLYALQIFTRGMHFPRRTRALGNTIGRPLHTVLSASCVNAGTFVAQFLADLSNGNFLKSFSVFNREPLMNILFIYGYEDSARQISRADRRTERKARCFMLNKIPKRESKSRETKTLRHDNLRRKLLHRSSKGKHARQKPKYANSCTRRKPQKATLVALTN